MLRTIGRQLLADGQRLCLESSERVVAAFRPRIHCENHALFAVTGCSVYPLATIDPDGFRLVGIRSEKMVSSMMRRVLEGNAYVFNGDFPGGEVIVRCPQCNRDAMWHEDVRKLAV